MLCVISGNVFILHGRWIAPLSSQRPESTDVLMQVKCIFRMIKCPYDPIGTWTKSFSASSVPPNQWTAVWFLSAMKPNFQGSNPFAGWLNPFVQSSGNLTIALVNHNILIGKSPIHGPFSIAMVVITGDACHLWEELPETSNMFDGEMAILHCWKPFFHRFIFELSKNWLLKCRSSFTFCCSKPKHISHVRCSFRQSSPVSS